LEDVAGASTTDTLRPTEGTESSFKPGDFSGYQCVSGKNSSERKQLPPTHFTRAKIRCSSVWRIAAANRVQLIMRTGLMPLALGMGLLVAAGGAEAGKNLARFQ
jgi:hypothetical protein